MTYSKTCLGLLLAGITFLSACGGIRVVRVTRSGGEIALLGARGIAMDDAREEMAATCGGLDSYEIVEQGEVPVGQVQTTTQQTRGRSRNTRRGRVAGQQTVSQTSTQQQTEWRIIYECVGAEDDTAQHSVTIKL